MRLNTSSLYYQYRIQIITSSCIQNVLVLLTYQRLELIWFTGIGEANYYLEQHWKVSEPKEFTLIQTGLVSWLKLSTIPPQFYRFTESQFQRRSSSEEPLDVLLHSFMILTGMLRLLAWMVQTNIHQSNVANTSRKSWQALSASNHFKRTFCNCNWQVKV